MRHITIIFLVLMQALPGHASERSSSQIKRSSLRLPVNWEVMKSGFSSSAAASASETYVETWIYSQSEIDGAFLKSPRAKVPIIPLHTRSVNSELPETIVVGRLEFAQLLGLKPASQIQNGLPIFLSLEKETGETYEISLQSRNGEVLSVIMSLWR